MLVKGSNVISHSLVTISAVKSGLFVQPGVCWLAVTFFANRSLL